VSSLQLVKRNEIDVQLWDETIRRSANSLPYAFSWYLDIVAENWNALILGDYETVMPLVWLRKLGVKCLYQPYYCQQLGIFGNDLSKETQRTFLSYVAKRFSYVNINLNPVAQVVSGDFSLKPKKNLLLDLSASYNQLEKNYSENNRRNIKKALKTEVLMGEETDLKRFKEFYLGNVKRKEENFKAKHEAIFRKLAKTLMQRDIGKIYSAINKQGELLAACLLIHHKDHLINIINTSSALGKSSGASHFLFDSIIKTNAGSKITLDFEGSSIPGIARFYAGFGAREQAFYNYHTSIIIKQKQRFR
jgi:hypothetical protein